jgi:8-oxo-dGTP diphosphatase
MYTLRLIAVAMLLYEDELLMMKRSPKRTISPGQWAGIGGHLEPSEIGNPQAACLREVMEETGLGPENIENLELRYIVTRLNGSDLRQQFVYVGRSNTKEVTDSDEGELHWIQLGDILNRDIPYVYRSLLEHWLQHGHKGGLWSGTATLNGLQEEDSSGAGASMVWVPVHDPLLS